MNLVSRQEAAQYLEETDYTESDLVADLISHTSRMIAAYCGRTDWGPAESRTEYFHGGHSSLLVRYWPIVSITTIHDDVDHVWGTDTLLASDEYYTANMEEQGGIIHYEQGKFSCGFENIKVVYTGGYASVSAIPGELKTACLIQVEHDHLRRGEERYVNGEQARSKLLPEVLALVRRYRRLAI